MQVRIQIQKNQKNRILEVRVHLEVEMEAEMEAEAEAEAKADDHLAKAGFCNEAEDHTMVKVDRVDVNDGSHAKIHHAKVHHVKIHRVKIRHVKIRRVKVHDRAKMNA